MPIRNEDYEESKNALAPRKGLEEERCKLLENEPLKEGAALERGKEASKTDIHYYEEQVSGDFHEYQMQRRENSCRKDYDACKIAHQKERILPCFSVVR